jgi:hypothetical protein
MNPRTTSSYYARQAGNASREAGAARSEASLFRSLVAEYDAILRRAWADGRLPAGIVSDDLIERTRAALAGETQAKPMTVMEAVQAAADRLEREQGARQ